MSKTELRKAAVLLMSLSDDQAADLLARLDPHEALAVSAEMRDAGAITTEEQASVLLDFAAADAARGATRRAIEPRPFAFLRDVDCHTLRALLENERPHTIALVASHVPSAYGAELIAGLPPERQLAVIRSVASREPIDPEIVALVANALAERVSAVA
jgi:flagellar motor switch protein FliG